MDGNICHQLLNVLDAKFRIPFRPIAGDTGTTVVLVASDREHERDIRRILRKPEIRLEMGIRVFRTSADLTAAKDKFTDT